MPNGMDFEVYGPASIRRNDNFTLHRSAILPSLQQLQSNEELKYILFGDSAYSDTDFLVTDGGRGMASCRECIEWEYKDLKTMWKYLDYKHALQMRKQPIAKIFFVCMLLRNAHNCMNGSQTANYFNFAPPTFEEWVSQGPRAHPIPPNSLFSEHFHEAGNFLNGGQDGASDSESSDDEDVL